MFSVSPRLANKCVRDAYDVMDIVREKVREEAHAIPDLGDTLVVHIVDCGRLLSRTIGIWRCRVRIALQACGEEVYALIHLG